MIYRDHKIIIMELLVESQSLKGFIVFHVGIIQFEATKIWVEIW